MGQPDFLNTTICPYAYQQSTGVTDVNTLISDLRTLLVTTLGWTEPSTGLFKSPSNGGGQWYDILLTRISATNLELRVRDQIGHVIITRRIQIDASATVNYYCGKFYAFIDSLRATSEVFQSFLMESTPNNDGDYPWVVFANAYRSAADTADANGSTAGQLYMWEDTGGAVMRASRLAYPAINQINSGVGKIMGSGSLLAEPADTILFNPAWATPRYGGRMWQTYLADAGVAAQSDKVYMVSDAASATFRVIGLAFPPLTFSRPALRKAN